MKKWIIKIKGYKKVTKLEIQTNINLYKNHSKESLIKIGVKETYLEFADHIDVKLKNPRRTKRKVYQAWSETFDQKDFWELTNQNFKTKRRTAQVIKRLKAADFETQERDDWTYKLKKLYR